MILIGNGKVITLDPEVPYIGNGAVLVDDDTIAEVGTMSEMTKKYPDAQVLDAKGKVIMPGMINSHTHIYSAFARGMALKDAPPENFVQILERLWWRLDKALTLDDIKYSAFATIIECIQNGTTTIFDHHASPNSIKDSLFAIAEVAKQVGIRSCLCYEVSDRDGEAKALEGVKENEDFVKHTNKGDQDLVKGMFGLHASFTLSNKTLEKCAEIGQTLDTGYHIHVAEGHQDVTETLNKYGKRVVHRLAEFDMLGEKSIAVHGIHINEAEMELLKDSNTNVVHNPESNMNNAVGCAPVPHMIKKGINVGLGTDGYTHDMFESMKVANIIHKHFLCDPNAIGPEVFQMAFENNTKIASEYFEKPVGILKKGAYADIITVDYRPYTPMNADNTNSHIIAGMSGRCVDTVMINGKVVMENNTFVDVDVEEIFRKATELAELVWKRF